jgi:hypothetical protein
MEAIRSSETSVLIRATRRHLPEDDNHHSHRRGNLKSYKKCNILGLDAYSPDAHTKCWQDHKRAGVMKTDTDVQYWIIAHAGSFAGA